MVFDLSPLTINHLILLLVCFIASFTWIGSSRQRQKSIVYAGVPLIITSLIASSFVIEEPRQILGLAIAGLLIMLIGGLDERYELPPAVQFAGQILIILTLVLSGWTIPYVTNPFGSGVLFLNSTFTTVFLYAPLWTFAWLLLTINAVNWLDGLDGLASGVGIAGFAVLAAISLLPATQDAQTLALALLNLGVLGGFYVWNVAPAKAYLGTTGSWYLGIMLGLAALIGGGKIATTLLVLAVPIFDAALVIVTRLMMRQPPWQGDTKYHVHHRLQAAGLSGQTIAVALTVISLLLGLPAVLFHTSRKLWLLAIIVGLIAIGYAISIRRQHLVK
ncbi:MAG: undecaprenyl/decaprenyl-phosphate alpha-N-acetylglucosaminyl 1-phosphate transferase [Candidatus Andersenbacteria bacterium]|nr:undecaprenyl/decaprenyl-phosphate alpha-N-acetylglucosaminyl 1-phosphate transferase [Candidatus Andersenbacteria bacterium]